MNPTLPRQLGGTTTTGPGVWLGIAGLVLSAGIMIAMGFHKPPATYRRRRS